MTPPRNKQHVRDLLAIASQKERELRDEYEALQLEEDKAHFNCTCVRSEIEAYDMSERVPVGRAISARAYCPNCKGTGIDQGLPSIVVRPCLHCGALVLEEIRCRGEVAEDTDGNCPKCKGELYPVARHVRLGEAVNVGEGVKHPPENVK